MTRQHIFIPFDTINLAIPSSGAVDNLLEHSREAGQTLPSHKATHAEANCEHSKNAPKYMAWGSERRIQLIVRSYSLAKTHSVVYSLAGNTHLALS